MLSISKNSFPKGKSQKPAWSWKIIYKKIIKTNPKLKSKYLLPKCNKFLTSIKKTLFIRNTPINFIETYKIITTLKSTPLQTLHNNFNLNSTNNPNLITPNLNNLTLLKILLILLKKDLLFLTTDKKLRIIQLIKTLLK